MIFTPPNLTLSCVLNETQFSDSASGKSWSKDALQQALLIELLNFLTHPRLHEDAVSYLRRTHGLSPRQAEDTIYYLVEAGLTIKSVDAAQPGIPEIVRWREANWEAALHFQEHTNRLPKMDYKSDPRDVNDRKIMAGFLALEAPPSNYKTMEHLLAIPLGQQHNVDCSFEFAYDPEASYRTSEQLSFNDLACMTYHTFGETHVRMMQLTGAHVGKTSPSGGSRHPTEAYIINLETDGMEPGLYHYSVLENALHLLKRSSLHEWVLANIIVMKDLVYFKPSAVYILTCIPERSMFRYRDSRSYRVLHHDVGHLLETWRSLARSMGRPFLTGYSLNDDAACAFMELDGLSEFPMAYIMVG